MAAVFPQHQQNVHVKPAVGDRRKLTHEYFVIKK